MSLAVPNVVVFAVRPMSISVRKTVVFLTGCLFLVSVALAQNVRSGVSTTGSDAASCTVLDPCRTFTAAMARTNPNGEVIALSSGGYGPFTITQSVSVISPLAFHAAIAPTAGAAITVNAPGATVILRGLYLNSQGANTGVSVSSAAIAHLENLVVNAFGGNGIEILGASQVFVKDAEIRGSFVSGLFAGPASGEVILTLDRVRLERNSYGLVADSGVRITGREILAAASVLTNFWFRNDGALAALRVTIENSLASDAGVEGFLAEDGARVTIRNSAAVRNSFDGFRAGANVADKTTELFLDQCLAAENLFGVIATSQAGGSAIITISNCMVVRNAFWGIGADLGGTVRAFDNTVTNNGVGINGEYGTFESNGQNKVHANGTNAIQPIGLITPM